MICALILVLFALGLFQTGLTSAIQSVETVEEAVGENALLSCQILKSENVEHVTWQKQTQDGGINLASSNTIHGSRVISAFRGKVEVIGRGLHNSSIVIKNVTGFHDAGTRIGCAVQVLSRRKDAFVQIPDVNLTPTSGLDEGSGSASRSFIGMWIGVVTCLCTASALAVLLIRKLRSRLSLRDQEKTEVPQTADADTVKIPLFTPEKSSVSNRTPHSKSQQRKGTDPESSSTARRIQSDQVKVDLFPPEKSSVKEQSPPSKSQKNKETDHLSSSARRLDFDQ